MSYVGSLANIPFSSFIVAVIVHFPFSSQLFSSRVIVQTDKTRDDLQ